MKLLIRNLDRKTTEAELGRLFTDFGEIQTCTLVLDQQTGASKGFGFVEMAEEQAAKDAIQALDRKKVGANKIRVKLAVEKPEVKEAPATQEVWGANAIADEQNKD